MFKAVVALVLALATGPALAAGDYCRPKDGKDRIPKTGTCPTGYVSNGDCCEALHTDTKKAFPRIEGRPCPSGTYASGGSCVSFR